MSQNFRALFMPRSLRVAIACMFLRGGLVVWFETIAEP